MNLVLNSFIKFMIDRLKNMIVVRWFGKISMFCVGVNGSKVKGIHVKDFLSFGKKLSDRVDRSNQD